MPDVFVSNKPQFKTSNQKRKNEYSKPSFLRPGGEKNHNFPGHTHNPFTSFCYYPDRVKLVSADPEEKMVLLLRAHPIINIKWISTAFLMYLLPPFFPLVDFYGILPQEFQLIISLVWYLLTSAFVLENFLSWFFHVNIVTDERIIEVDFFNLVSREITDANIDQIQDVTPRVIGAVRTFFNYGDVVIQTAASIPLITFEAVPDPDKVARILRESRVEEEQEKLEGRVR